MTGFLPPITLLATIMFALRLGMLLVLSNILWGQVRLDPIVGGRPPATQQVSGLNFDFAYLSQGLPVLWGFNAGAVSEYDEFMDPSFPFSGAPSLRIRSLVAPASDGGFAYLNLLPSPLSGHTVYFTGAIRTAGATNGFATLRLEVEDASGNTNIVNLQPNAPTGTADWQTYTISAPIPAGAIGIQFAVGLRGIGAAWFAGLSASMDGIPAALPHTVPLPEQVEWLAANAFPFTTLDAGANDAELAPLQKLIGNARIVGLGEGTHGSSEFFRMKSRIISYLARNMGFTVFAIEASLPEAYVMNNYILNGVGDPKTLLAGLYFWTWNTQEVLDMVQWMREFNASGQGRIEFLGFDMQYAAVAMNNVAAFLAAADPASLSFLSGNYMIAAQTAELSAPSASQSSGAIAAAQAVWQRLTDNRATYIQSQPAEAVDFAIENASIVVQALTYQSLGQGQNATAYRDAQMAANIEWIASQHPNERIILWAHDQHINKIPGLMGSYLAGDFGSDYLALGSLFHAGFYNAEAPNIGLVPNIAVASIPGCVEYFFHQSGVPQQILDTRLASADARLSSWLTAPLWVRTIGSQAVPGFYLVPPYAQAYDGIVFFDAVTPSQLLPFPFLITSTTLSSGTKGTPYYQNLVSTYGSVLVTWQVASGTLPPGLTLAADGALSGTPQADGTYRFSVTASSNGYAGPTSTIQVSIVQ